jgi:hypothetical protein
VDTISSIIFRLPDVPDGYISPSVLLHISIMRVGEALRTVPGVVSVDGLADLVQAVAWLIVALVFIYVFRSSIRSLMARRSRGGALGEGLALSDDFNRLVRQGASPVKNPTAHGSVDSADLHEFDQHRRHVLEEASKSPEVALIALSGNLEHRIRLLSATTGWGSDQRDARHQVESMPLPDSLRAAVGDFWQVRNKVVHGGSATDREVLSAIDSGLTVYEALQRTATEKNYVNDPALPVFADSRCSELRTDVHGVRLQTVSPDGSVSFRVFPTTRTHFQKGRQVAWEWSGRDWGPSWYRNRDTGEVEQAWTSSIEFVGRNLTDL